MADRKEDRMGLDLDLTTVPRLPAIDNATGFQPGVAYYSGRREHSPHDIDEASFYGEGLPPSKCDTCPDRNTCPLPSFILFFEDRPFEGPRRGNIIDTAADGSIIPDMIIPPGER
jgi:hypothetical protein